MFDEWDVVATRPNERAPIDDPWGVFSSRPNDAVVPNPVVDIHDAQMSAQQIATQIQQAGQRMLLNAVSHALRGYTPEELAKPGSFTNPRTGERSNVAGDQASSPLDIPQHGVQQIGSGAQQIAGGLAQPSASDGHTVGMYGVPLPAPPMNPAIASGLGDVAGGAMDAGSVALPGAMADAPLAVARALVGGSAAQKGTETGLEKAGVARGYARLAGAGAGIVGGVLAHGKAPTQETARAVEPAVSPDPPLEPTSEQAPLQPPAPSKTVGGDGWAVAKVEPSGPPPDAGWEVAATRPNEAPQVKPQKNTPESNAGAPPETPIETTAEQPQPASQQGSEASLRDRIASAIEQAEPRARGGALTSVPEVRKLLPDVPKEDFDRTLMQMGRDGDLSLHKFSGPLSVPPEERASLAFDNTPVKSGIPGIPDDPGTYYGGVTFRKPTTEYSASGPAGLVAEKFESIFGKKGEPAEDYSGVGGFKDKIIRNGSQLEEADPDAHLAFLKAASSKAKAATLIKTAEPHLAQALGDAGPSLDNFKRTLIESRLQGTQQRWTDLADEAYKVPDDKLTDWAANGPLQILARMGDKDWNSRAQAAAALAEKAIRYRDNVASLRPDQVNPKAPDILRNYIGDAFDEAANSVKHVMSPDEFKAASSSPAFHRALKVYKDQYEQPMAQSHGENEGVFSNALGPLNTYYPLVAAAEDRPMSGLMRALPFKRPRNISNGFTTGLSEDYDASVAAFKDRLSGAFRTNDRAQMLDTLRAHGLIRPLKPGTQPDVFSYQGKDFTAQAVQTSLPRTVYQDGKVTHLPGKTEVMPAWLHRELQPLLESGKRPAPGVLSKIVDAVNSLSLAGGADVVYHAHNLLGALVANTPFLGKDLASKTVGNLPFTKIFTALVKVATVDPMSEASAAKLQELAQVGALPERYGSATYSKWFAEKTGAKHEPFSAAPMLYGPNGIDVRARLAMYDAAKAINPNVKGAELAHFVNQLGNYTHALQGSIERQAKSTGLSPFFTAGRQMIENGVNSWLGTGPKAGGKAGSIIAQQLSGGAVGLVGSWVAAYRAYTGKWPWEDQRAQLLKIPLNPQDRMSAIAKAMYGQDAINPAKQVYVNFGFLSPLVGRGARALGLSGSFRAGVEHGSAPQVMEGGIRDVANSAIHPFTGPLPRTAIVAATGKQPYLVGDSDAGGSKFMPAIDKHAPIGSEVLQGLRQINSLGGGLSDLTGFGSDKSDGNRYLKALLDMTGLSGGAANPYAAEQALRKERYMRRAQ